MLAPVQARSFDVPVGESRVYKFKQPLTRVAVGNPNVADYILLNPTEVYVLGKKVGKTNLITWDRKGTSTTHSLRIDLNLSPLRSLLRDVMPHETDIKIMSSGAATVVTGSVADTLTSDAVMALVNAYLQNKTGQSDDAKNTSSGLNLLKIRDPQQVMLEVRIAEVSKSYLETLGVSWGQNVGGNRGSSLLTGFVDNATLNLFFKSTPDVNNNNLSPNLMGNNLQIEAERKDGLVKILAEPTIVAISGEKGYFLVGGKVFLPTETESGSTTYTERSYGVELGFTPTVLTNGLIQLKVEPEVSEPTQGVGSLPSFVTSKVSTTVKINEGENLVIGGLLRDNFIESIKALPILGEIPIFGALFRRTEMIKDQTELVVVVRPTLVKASSTRPALPTDNFVPPTRKELFIDGQLQGTPKSSLQK
jgi:pilus assembly protein CpaC